MRTSHLGFALAVALSLATAGLAQAGVSADINLHAGGRPAPVVLFDREPDVMLVPNTRVYAVSGLDYDLFRYGQYWYINDGGYWYRARNYRGPFGAIRFEGVPRQIVVVPGRYHHHPMHPFGGPPGQMKKRGNDRDDRDGIRIIRGNDKHRGDDGDRGKHGNREGHGKH